MSLIVKAAYLWMCSCELHGRIIFADGKKSDPFMTKAKALRVLDRAKKSDQISSEEAKAVLEQIEARVWALDESEEAESALELFATDMETEHTNPRAMAIRMGQMLH